MNSRWKTHFVTLNLFKKTVIYIKKGSFLFILYHLFVIFFNSETSLNFSSLIGKIFVKTQNFDSYDVIMM